MERENKGAAIGWLIGGIVVGTVGALLIAPQSGSLTRRLLGKHAQKGGKTLIDSSQDIVTRGRELYERGREIAEEAADLFERGRKIAEKTIEDRI